MLHINQSYLPTLQAHNVPDKDLRRWARFLLKCGEVMCKRWTSEHVRRLREQHRRGRGKQTPCPKVREIVIVRDNSNKRNHWKLPVVKELIKGRDGIIRAAKLKSSRHCWESSSVRFNISTLWSWRVWRSPGPHLTQLPLSVKQGHREMLLSWLLYISKKLLRSMINE